MEKENRMGTEPIKHLIWKLGMPMVVSMVLQAIYNVVDSIFVANMEGVGALANEALTYAFPVQIFMIAVGVGTGVGINALLSKSLGEGDKEKASRVAGTGIFLALVLYLVFLLFGLFASKWFIGLFTSDPTVLEMGSNYLSICCCLSLGSIGYAVYERFLQATGKTMLSTISQISGAVINIVFDYVFIFPCGMGVEGAAWATIFGQLVSLAIAMCFHYFANREISGNPKYIRPRWHIIQEIYAIGLSAAIMQALLSVMMAGVNAILGLSEVDSAVLIGSFGIYYKIQQIALFSCFGLSNTIITVLSFQYGRKEKKRSLQCVKYGIIDTLIVSLALTVLFEAIARPLAQLFSLSGGSTAELIDVTEKAVHIASIGYIFMGFSVAVQGVFQALRYSFLPLLTALLRLAVFVFPTAYLFVCLPDVLDNLWWVFPIAEFLTAVVSFFLLRYAIKKKIAPMEENSSPVNE